MKEAEANECWIGKAGSPEKNPGRFRHIVVLTQRTDLKDHLVPENAHKDYGEIFHPRQKISGVLKVSSINDFVLENDEFGSAEVTVGKPFFVGRQEELREAWGKPVDIAIDGSGKHLALTVHDGKDVRILQDSFPKPARPYGLMPLERADSKSFVEISGKLTHVHDTHLVELQTKTGPILIGTGHVFGDTMEPDETRLRELQKMIDHEVMVRPGKTLTVIEQTPERKAEKEPKNRREVFLAHPMGPGSYTVQQERTIGDRDAGADHAMWSGRVVGVDRERQTIDMESLIGGAPGVTRIHLQGSVPEGVEVGQRQKVAFDKETRGYTVASPDRSVQRSGQDRGIGA